MSFVRGALVSILGLACLAALLGVAAWFRADMAYAQGRGLADIGYPAEAKISLATAVRWWPWEPAYQRALAGVNADLAEISSDDDCGGFLMAADRAGQRAWHLNPRNLLTLKSLIHMYFSLAMLDDQYVARLESLIQPSLTLCPSDPILWYYQALFLATNERTTEALSAVNRALDLKPDYQAALSFRERLLADEP